jgi:hypothetical protein
MFHEVVTNGLGVMAAWAQANWHQPCAWAGHQLWTAISSGRPGSN